MSTLKTTNLQNASAASPAFVLASDGSATANLSSLNGGPIAGSRNRVINGDMRIDQRNAGASVTPTDNQYSIDRWSCGQNVASKFSVQQNAGSVTPPPGFSNYLGCASLSAYTPTGSNYFYVAQTVEGFNLSDFAWGTANARTVTLSFWVRSSLTGTFGGALSNGSRAYPYAYTISAANTWEYKTITFAGDTSGTWNSTNGYGVAVRFSLGTGSTYAGTAGSWQSAELVTSTGATSVVGTNGATFYITGVQLEPGTVATPFERRSYGAELALCQRYYTQSYNANTAPGTVTDSGSVLNICQATTSYLPISPISLPVEMRSNPSVTIFNTATGSSTASVCMRNLNTSGNLAGYVSTTGAKHIGIATNNASVPGGNIVNAHYTASAEL